jgi:23S rRNA pseudouridine2605 synthase
MTLLRLQKLMSAAGVASRRASEDLILEGRVEINDEIVLELGRKVDTTKDVVRFDGEIIKMPSDSLTIAVYKPTGVVSTMEDPQGRPTLADLVGGKYGRLFHIGRLDTDSEGLILMSNDGDLAQTIAHPENEIPKTYIATVNGKVSGSTIKEMLQGFELRDGFTKFDKARILATTPNESVVEVVLHSGKNRIVRRMFKNFGHKVTKLVRVQIGPIRIGELKPGRSRVLSDVEVSAIEAMATRGKKSSTYDVSKKSQARAKNKARNEATFAREADSARRKREQ